MDNIYSRAHGGAVFGLIDEAFETAGQTEGTIAVALNVNITYVASPQPGVILKAEAKRVSQTKKTAGYEIKVTDEEGRLIATCQALAYRTGKPKRSSSCSLSQPATSGFVGSTTIMPSLVTMNMPRCRVCRKLYRSPVILVISLSGAFA